MCGQSGGGESWLGGLTNYLLDVNAITRDNEHYPQFIKSLHFIVGSGSVKFDGILKC